MFGMGGGFNGPGGNSSNSGSAPSGKSMAGPNKGGDGMSPSERNSQGKEGSHSGPGNPGHSPSTSGGGNNAGREGAGGGPGGPAGAGRDSGTNAGHEFSGFGSREGQRAGPGNPSAGGGMAERGDRAAAEKGNRVGADGFGGLAGNTPTGFSPTGSSLAHDFSPPSISSSVSKNATPTGGFSPDNGFQPTGFEAAAGGPIGATPADMERAQRQRAAENTSMDTYSAAVANRKANETRADLASSVRADENRSVANYNAAAANSAANARRADVASTARAAENTSMNPFHDALNNFLGLTRRAEATLPNPYDTLSGGKKADIENMTIAEAAAFADKNWKGKTANVLGGYQFKDTTLVGIANDMGISLDTKMTAEVQSQLAMGLAQRRANEATVNGVVDVDKFARALSDEWASFKTSTGKGAYTGPANKPSVDYGTVRDIAQGLVDTGVVGPRRSLSAMGDDPALTASATGVNRSTAPSATKDSFASTYLGRSQPGPEFGRVGTITGISPEMAYFGDEPTGISDEESAKNIGLQEQRRREAAAAPEDATPKNASIAGGDKPKADEGVFPDRPRSLGAKIAAGGIDILSSFIPGAGPYIGMANAGLSLTGNRTIGERVVDGFSGLDGTGGTLNPSYQGEQHDQLMADATQPPQATAKPSVKPTVEKFADTYLKDSVNRPTPTEKWDTRASDYGNREYA